MESDFAYAKIQSINGDEYYIREVEISIELDAVDLDQSRRSSNPIAQNKISRTFHMS